MSINREYKDRLFKFIFGNPEHKEWTLSLYNAVNGTDHTDPEDLDINTIEDAVYMSMKNDVSFTLYETMNFYEQQSTFNPNMPLRFLIYMGMAYSRYIDINKSYHRFSTKQQTLPTPKCICFYNGVDEHDDVVLKLSDSFTGCHRSDAEVSVTMKNINYGHNKELLEACIPLRDYSYFVSRIRFHQQTMDLKKAVDAALRELDDASIIKPFLTANKAEVELMCITEYDEERTLNEFREEGRAEGRAEGREETQENNLRGFVRTFKPEYKSIDKVAEFAAKTFKISIEEALEKVKVYWEIV